MKRIYSCILCDWTKISDNIIDFNVHASTEHAEVFFDDPESRFRMRNNKRLRDYVRTDPIEKDRRKEYDR